MRRRSVLTGIAAASAIGLAGCAGVPTDGTGESDAPSVAEGFAGDATGDADGDDTEGTPEPDRPGCEVESAVIDVDVGGETREFETAATVPYPASPAAVGEASSAEETVSVEEAAIADYVPAFEEAYLTHEILCDRTGSGHVLSVDYRTDRIEGFDRDGGGRLVYLRYAGGATAGVDGDGGMWQADIGFSAVLYAVDATGAARVELDDPRDRSRSEIRSELPNPVEAGDLVAVFE
ncbi:hypothetical protein [Halorubrum amylolyticum]|uniref:hypothetical protein n=1 Tax=Halorubrum amylolyticum TaxID=2508724 RepID=UPI001008991A|nr:hypothetical protein [Halorubrum amylolyticum]